MYQHPNTSNISSHMNCDSQNLAKGALVGTAAYLLVLGGKRLWDHMLSTNTPDGDKQLAPRDRALRDVCTVSTLATSGALLFAVFGPKDSTSYFY